jgi:hypothetical protein
MLFFRSEEHVIRWCRTWKIPRGATLSINQCWGLAKGWYADRLSANWRPKSPDQAEALFQSLGLRSKFWRMKKP